ncbi:hypothetical protein [Sessilibacter corallicola]|uniref:hypothetical protein n=1 Tax=Sessilibacter corallicola TaxID=2904075 RepID=UPI001E391100|nr:hypothetical protein [Sessilibacter corallicola]MCE2029459.1 hypothetical protein [Sessilibacter corallicola]
MELPKNVRVASWLGAECVSSFLQRNDIVDRRLEDFTNHMSSLVFSENVPEWDDVAMKLQIDGMGDPLPDHLDSLVGLDELLISVREISASQIYGTFYPREVESRLIKAIEISRLDLSNYNLFRMVRVSTKPEGWGPPLTEEFVDGFHLNRS